PAPADTPRMPEHGVVDQRERSIRRDRQTIGIQLASTVLPRDAQLVAGGRGAYVRADVARVATHTRAQHVTVEGGDQHRVRDGINGPEQREQLLAPVEPLVLSAVPSDHEAALRARTARLARQERDALLAHRERADIARAGAASAYP